MSAINYSNTDEFMEGYPPANVIYCYGNYAVVDLVKNLMISARNVGMNIVLFALDKQIAKEMSGICDVVNRFDDSVDSDKYYIIGERGFNDVMWQGWLIGTDILRSGRSYIYMDVDIVIRKNFEKDLLRCFMCCKYDCLVQFNGKNACTGFYSMIPNERTVDLFTIDFLVKNKYLGHEGDQSFFNHVLVREGKFLSVKFLSREKYPNGAYYYENHDRIDDVCNIVHFNCIHEYADKVNKMKEHGLWLLQ